MVWGGKETSKRVPDDKYDTMKEWEILDTMKDWKKIWVKKMFLFNLSGNVDTSWYYLILENDFYISPTI